MIREDAAARARSDLREILERSGRYHLVRHTLERGPWFIGWNYEYVVESNLIEDIYLTTRGYSSEFGWWRWALTLRRLIKDMNRTYLYEVGEL